MPTTARLRAAAVATAAAALAAGLGSAGPAGAVDQTKPTPTCAGTAFKDPAGDQNNTQVPEDQRTTSTELLSGFLNHDPAKAAEATTYNVVVKDLKLAVPTGWTTISWTAYYVTPDDKQRFVRAIYDFAGASAFEFGSFTPNPTGVGLTGVSQVEGKTTGKFFEGASGIVQFVIPAEHAKAGTTFKGLYALSTQGRTLPASANTPSRGISPVLDTAPDTGIESTAKYTVAPCATAAPAPAPGPVTAPGPGTTAPGGSQTSDTTPGGGPLPVTLVTKAVKGKKVKKALALKLKSSEAVTGLAAQLRKGKTVVARGKLARLDGAGTLKLKVTRKLKKGTYTLDLAGTDAGGTRRLTAANLKVR